MKTSLRDHPLFFPYFYLNGRWQDTDEHTPLYAPYHHQEIAQLPVASLAHIEEAITAARRAFECWKKTTDGERARCLYKWYEAVLSHQAALVELIIHEQGMPIRDARAEVLYAASFIKWCADTLTQHRDQLLPALQPNQYRTVERRPLGVCTLITPANLPASMVTKKLAAALAAGCTTILKPAEATPLTACALVQLLISTTALPTGVVNLLMGDPQMIGAHLTTHPLIDQVSFTGSAAVGRHIACQTAPTLKKCVLELGGNAFALIWPDADWALTLKAITDNKKRASGQTCIAMNRFYLLREQAPAFLSQLCDHLHQWQCGAPDEETTDIGPLISEAACHNIQTLIDEACQLGARCLIGGTRHPTLTHYCLPTILTQATHHMRIAHTEIFGPVFTFYLFDQLDEMVEAACSLPSGLCNYLFTQDLRHYHHLRERVESGMLIVNAGSFSHASVPFGGVHSSGQAREGSFLALEDYSYTQYHCVHW